MLSTAPRLLLRSQRPGAAPSDAPSAGTGRELLALLRGAAAGTPAGRPRFDPGLAGGLRAWLEDAAYGLVALRGDDAAPLVLGPRHLLGGDEDHSGATTAPPGAPGACQGAPAPADPAPANGALEARLVHALFRQLVHTGTVGDPLAEALDALGATGATASVRAVESLPTSARDALAGSLAAQAANLRALVPRFASGWMPRTDDHVSIPLAGGRVVLQGTFDLLVGTPSPGTASLCALGLSTGGPWPRDRQRLHYLALLEALRSGTPPFRLALIESTSGRYGVEDVREEHLRALSSHIVAWLAREGQPHPSGGNRA